MAVNDYVQFMHALYRKRYTLPSLILGLLLYACDHSTAPPSISDAELEALQEAEALRHSIQEQERQQRRIDALLDVYREPAR